MSMSMGRDNHYSLPPGEAHIQERTDLLILWPSMSSRLQSHVTEPRMRQRAPEVRGC